MSIYVRQKQFEKKVNGYEKLLKRALNGLEGSFKVNSSLFNINIRIRANRNIDNVINMLNERNNDLTIFKSFENNDMVLYQGYIKKDEYI